MLSIGPGYPLCRNANIRVLDVELGPEGPEPLLRIANAPNIIACRPMKCPGGCMETPAVCRCPGARFVLWNGMQIGPPIAYGKSRATPAKCPMTRPSPGRDSRQTFLSPPVAFSGRGGTLPEKSTSPGAGSAGVKTHLERSNPREAFAHFSCCRTPSRKA
jgi:hypothetical protein